MTASQKIKVLVVDDHNMVRKGLIVLLENFDDFEVVGEAGDGKTGILLCQQYKPDVVLMDMIMPVMDGIEATSTIRELCPETQVVALTSFSDDATIQNALKAGAISYLMKNVSVDELALAVRKAHEGQPTLAPEATRALIAASRRPPEVGHDLSEREREVLSLMVDGLNNREIAEVLTISNSTVKNHVSNIFAKLGTTSRTQAVALAVERKLVNKND
ncbi:MAG: response regulator transcription factor [Anaerolineae bacterium]|nr:response regulator transcription factor [Anaerolineae bacterium]